MLIQLTKDRLDTLTATEKQIVQYINNHVNMLPFLSISDIAEQTFSSPATVSRAIRKCGLDGFNELRYRISVNADSGIHDFTDIISKSQVEVTNTLERISIDEVAHAINLIQNSQKIYVISRGLTELVSKEFCLRLGLLGFHTFQIADPNIILQFSENITSDDLSILFSLNGHTEELIDYAKKVNLQGGKILTCCCNTESPLIPLSNVVICGYKHKFSSITKYEVASRLPLYVISRLIIDYLAANVDAKKNRLPKK